MVTYSFFQRGKKHSFKTAVEARKEAVKILQSREGMYRHDRIMIWEGNDEYGVVIAQSWYNYKYRWEPHDSDNIAFYGLRTDGYLGKSLKYW